jgi:DNA-binding transcriptional regulator YiaG
MKPIGAEDLRKAREALNETQWQFAARLGVNQGTVSRWERGRIPERGITQDFLRRRLNDIANARRIISVRQ